LIGKGAEWEEYGIVSDEVILGETVLQENDLLNEYYNLAKDSYKDLFELYPNEKFGENYLDESYAVKGLFNIGETAGLIGLNNDKREFYEKIVENYAGTNLANSAQDELNKLSSGISRESQALVHLNQESHFITLLKMDRPGFNELGAEMLFTINEKQIFKGWAINELKYLEVKGKKIPFKISEINDDSVEIMYAPEFSLEDKIFNRVSEAIIGRTAKWEKATLQLNTLTQLTPDVVVKLQKINFEKQVEVEIIPEVRNTRTEADFGFKIGIEKRGIKLSPEKTHEMITNLQEQIKKWSDINNKLSKIVKGLKGACFATTAILTVKNFFSGLSGKAQARNEVMTAKGGWNEKCRIAVSSGDNLCGKPATSVEVCLLNCNEQINKDVETYAEQLKNRNDEFKEIYKDPEVKKSDGLFKESYNSEKVREKYEGVFKEFCDKHKEDDILVKIAGDEQVNVLKTACGNIDKLSVTEMRDIITQYNSFKASSGISVLGDVSKKQLSSKMFDLNSKINANKEVDAIKDIWNDATAFAVVEKKKIIIQPMQKVSSNDGLGDATDKFYLKVPKSKTNSEIAGQYIVIGTKLVAGNYEIVSAKNSNGGDVTSEVLDYYKGKIFKKADASLYKNPYKERGVVKYYENAPYKGLPALVPFDKDNGWYAATDYIISGYGKPYEDSGRAVNFWICNVGEDGLFNFKQGDECRYYNVGTPASTLFPGLSERESNSLVSKAQKAIQDASRQYGEKEVIINNQKYISQIAEDGTSGRCTDFMSPADCNLMFNLCDPVICPASRCDYGEQYRVDNVIQSGIIGGLLLCLPNFPEVKIPVCLSGINAGIESYISILNSTEACLQESLETGRNIGICDEIKSIYLCEFFWKQAVPLLNVGIPRLIEGFFGQGSRGGGEYLTVNNAWKNAEKSIDYFKNQYAVNSFEAFNIRSTAEAGTEVCKSFVGTTYPASADFFDKLTEPDSPVQYTGWFDENVLNTATIPPTSHYKVYYHIYAGKDSGASYVVYLRAPRIEGLVQMTGDYVVDRGYIERGSQIDEAKDFTAPSGFTKMCISINGKETCDFKQVSTSAALNYVKDKYVSELTTGKDITTAAECVAGERGYVSLSSLNVQAMAEEAVQPQLYNYGIVRVCSTNNPGAQVEEKTGELDKTKSTYDRWKRVGYCDDKTIGCWVDTNSVEDVLSGNDIVLKQALDEINTSYLGKIDIMSQEDAEEILKNAKNVVDNIGTSKDLIGTLGLNKLGIEEAYGEIISDLTKFEDLGTTNNNKAYALFLKAEIYRKLAERIYTEGVLGEEKGIIPGKEEKGLQEIGIELKQGVWIVKDFGVYMGECNYKYENGKWTVRTISGKARGGIGTSPTNTISPNCLELEEYSYLEGLKKIAEEYDSVTIDKDVVTGENADERYNNLLKVLEQSKFTEEELVEGKEITLNKDGVKIPCTYKGGAWTCENDEDARLKNGLRNKNYEEGIRFLAEYADWTDDIIVDGQVIENTLFGSDEGFSEKILSTISKDSLFTLYNDFKKNPDKSIFHTFSILKSNAWEGDILKLIDEDIPFYDNSGFLSIRLKNDFSGKIVLKIFTEENNWFNENLPELIPSEDSVEIEMTGGESLIIDIDGKNSFILLKKGKTFRSKKSAIDNEVTIELISITQ